jgi:hypothetical protein
MYVCMYEYAVFTKYGTVYLVWCYVYLCV